MQKQYEKEQEQKRYIQYWQHHHVIHQQQQQPKQQREYKIYGDNQKYREYKKHQQIQQESEQFRNETVKRYHHHNNNNKNNKYLISKPMDINDNNIEYDWDELSSAPTEPNPKIGAEHSALDDLYHQPIQQQQPQQQQKLNRKRPSPPPPPKGYSASNHYFLEQEQKYDAKYDPPQYLPSEEKYEAKYHSPSEYDQSNFLNMMHHLKYLYYEYQTEPARVATKKLVDNSELKHYHHACKIFSFIYTDVCSCLFGILGRLGRII